MTEYEKKLDALFSALPPMSVEEMIEAGRDLDSRVHLPGEPDTDWRSLDVPDDTVPGE